MKISSEQHAKFQPFVTSVGGYAPTIVMQGLITLTGGQVPTAGIVDRAFDDSSTTVWRGLWLTPAALAFVEFENTGNDDWHAGRSGRGEVTRTDGWVRRLSSISSIQLRDVEATQPDFSSEYPWRAGGSIHFIDGVEVQVPLFEGSTSYWVADSASDFLSSVAAEFSRDAPVA
ncbi:MULTISPECIES: hypothetical protein [Nocardiaceae]|uniref:hypothetical protein n=1 Tax=Nocardiaceae TaxID=85025 RepID=UPI0012680221|nr:MULTISPECIES: hypothetical protein [Rhodococcus]